MNKPKDINEWAEANAYVGYNLDKINSTLFRIAEILEHINWNLGVLANPGLKKKYPEDAKRELEHLQG